MGLRHLATISAQIDEAGGVSSELAVAKAANTAAEQRLLGGGLIEGGAAGA